MTKPDEIEPWAYARAGDLIGKGDYLSRENLAQALMDVKTEEQLWAAKEIIKARSEQREADADIVEKPSNMRNSSHIGEKMMTLPVEIITTTGLIKLLREIEQERPTESNKTDLAKLAADALVKLKADNMHMRGMLEEISAAIRKGDK